MIDTLLGAASLAMFVFGALAFSTLALFYWGERLRGHRRRHTLFPLFTLVCAAAFLTNLLAQAGLAQAAGAWLATAILALRAAALGLLPPLMLHLVLENAAGEIPARRAWRWLLNAFYAAGAAIAAARILQGAGLLSHPWSDELYRAPAAALAASAALGILALLLSPRPPLAAGRAHRRWIAALLLLLLICAAAALVDAGAYLSQFPDYLLLAFFCVSLYYRERLVFFDVLMKRGLFLALGLAAVTALAASAEPSFARLPAALWLYACGMSLWLAGPWLYGLVARAVDHAWLRRPYSVVEAERQFIRDVEGASTVEELQARAAASLSSIFQAPAQILAGDVPSQDDALSAPIGRDSAREGSILLPPRPNGIPYLSDDRRLLQSLAATLAMVAENVRFRADRRLQEQREQQLRLLASRAELKALRAQINPHFLFNALSVIAGLIHYRPDLADETIERLAQVFRYTLRKSESEWAPLAEEIEFIAAYLAVEQARFGERMTVEIDMDPAAAHVLIPAMSVQPLVENAVKHGLSAREGPGVVGLRASLAGEMLLIEVFDNGPGFPPGFSLQEPGESRGLRNVDERLRGYYGAAARLSWENGADGARVTLSIPQAPIPQTAPEVSPDAPAHRG